MKIEAKRRIARASASVVVAVLIAAGLSSCGNGATTAIEIAGVYDDGFGTTITVEGDRWTLSGMDFSAGFTLTHIDNEGHWAVAHNDASNAFSPDLYSRFEWVRVGSDLYYCQAPYDAATEAAAFDAARPDRTDPSSGGCAMFPWSPLHAVSR